MTKDVIVVGEVLDKELPDIEEAYQIVAKHKKFKYIVSFKMTSIKKSEDIRKNFYFLNAEKVQWEDWTNILW